MGEGVAHPEACAEFADTLAVGVDEDEDALCGVEPLQDDLLYRVRPFVLVAEDGVVEVVVLADVLVFADYTSGASVSGTDFSRNIATCAR